MQCGSLRSSLRNLCGDDDRGVTLNDMHHSIKKPVSTHCTLNFLYHAPLLHYQTKASTLRVQFEYIPFSTTTGNPCSLILVNATFIVGDDRTTVRDKVYTLCSTLPTREIHQAFFAIRHACAPPLLPWYVRCDMGLEEPPIRCLT